MSDDIRAELDRLRHEMDRLRAVTDIQNLMGTYTVNHIPKNMHDHVELFAMEREDVSVEVGDRGLYVGPDAVRALFGELLHVAPDSIAVTGHTTEGMNIASFGLRTGIAAARATASIAAPNAEHV